MKTTDRTRNMLSKAAPVVVLITGFLFAVVLQLAIHTEFLVCCRCERRLAHEKVSGVLKPAFDLKV